jgi:heme oxygenase
MTSVRSDVIRLPVREDLRSLSLLLREETSALHHVVEQGLGLPRRIATLDLYRSCLTSFYRIYRPLEACLGRFDQWRDISIDLSDHVHTPRLAADLQTLGLSPLALADAPSECLPALGSFSAALGALYVVEGSTLGSQFIWRHVSTLLGEQIAGADSFFYGRGALTGARWNQFRAALDTYGILHPQLQQEVVRGATVTFQAIGGWMQR